MGKLAAALAWADRGFRVFPLQINSRLPTDLAWTLHATTDTDTIRAWWTDPVLGVERDNNIGFLTTGWIVPDVDVKDGRAGLQTMAELDLDFDTLTTRTPSGGYHLIYRGLDHPVGSGHLLHAKDGIDVKSHNGYVVAPGSTIDGVPYIVEIDLPPAPFPAHARRFLKTPKERTRNLVAEALSDTPETINVATHYLQREAKNADKGTRGWTCYTVACRLRDLGVSEETATDLLFEHWNEKNNPPMEVDDLLFTVGNAYRYATGEAGGASPAAAFGEIVPVETPAVAADLVPHSNGSTYRFGTMMDVSSIATRPVIFGDILLAQVVTTLIAAPGGGKSMFTLTVAAHLAMGRDFMGYRCHRPGKSIVINPEDDLAETSRRLNAICELYGFDKDVVRSRIAIVSDDVLNLQLTQNRPPTAHMAHVNDLAAAAADPDVVLVVIDPLAEAHSANENDNPEMNYVMRVVRSIARAADCAVLVVHHTGKPPAAKSSVWVGDQNAGRGASSVPGAARVVLTLFPAAEADCLDIGVPPDTRGQYVRLDDGKKSYGVRGAAQWLRWRSARLTNGDNVGVLVPHDVGDAYKRQVQDLADLLSARMLREGAASMTLEEAVRLLVTSDPMAAKEDHGALRTRIARLLQVPVPIGGAPTAARIACVVDIDAGKRQTRVVLS